MQTAAEHYPLEVLAAAEVRSAGGPPEDVAGALYNLRTAAALGQLVRFFAPDGSCIGFVAWLRLTPGQLLEVVQRKVRLFDPVDNTPNGPVCFIVEQLNAAGVPELSRRMRVMSAIPGVQILAGWRGERLRCYRTRPAHFVGTEH